MNPKELHILLLEDRDTDAEMVLRELRQDGLQFTVERVMTESGFLAALSQPEIDLILSDYSLPTYDGLSALTQAKERRPEVPFVFVSGTMGEEAAVEALHHGAVDYVLKHRLARLGPAVRRALREVGDRAERQQAEQELRESEARYRSLFENLQEGFAYCRMLFERGQPADFVYLEVNQAFERLTGLQNVVGKKVSEVIPGIQQSNPELFEIYGRVALGGKPERFEAYVAPLGIWFSVSVYCPAKSDFVAVFDNITERKETEAALRHRLELKEQIAKIAATVPGMIYSFRLRSDGTMCMPYASPALDEIYGLQLEQVRNDAAPAMSLIHPDDSPRIHDAIAESARNMTPWREEFRVRTKFRGEIWVEGNSVPQREPDDSVLWHGFLQDITERKRAEETFRLQSAALNAAANVTVITDPNGLIQWVNPAFTAITGYSFEEAIGKNPRDLMKSGQHDAAFYRKLWETVLAGKAWRDEIINRNKSGGLYTEDLTITPLFNERREITHFIAIGQDITEKKKLMEQFLRAQRLDSVGRLAGGIAHDLNNILAPILMMPPLLRQALPPGQPQRLVDTIETNAQRGADIIKQMLVFSRGIGGKHAPVQLRTLIRDMLRVIRETFPKNITARSQLGTEVGLVSGDATQLHQILMNLCVNARDAMPSGGTLTIGLEQMDVDETFARTGSRFRPGRYVVLTVTDTGTGIPPEHLDQIFDPFFTTKQVGEGTGLGLSTVLGIVQNHHGFIQVNSLPGQGAQFRVCLPACESATSEIAPPPPGTLPRGNGELVLVVDDEDEVRGITRTILEQHGYRVAEAQNGVEALTVIVSQQAEVRVVVTDLMMPYMDGAAFIRALSHTKSSVKVIATTGNPLKPEMPDDLKAQVQGYLPKPFRLAELLEVLHRVLHPAE